MLVNATSVVPLIMFNQLVLLSLAYSVCWDTESTTQFNGGACSKPNLYNKQNTPNDHHNQNKLNKHNELNAHHKHNKPNKPNIHTIPNNHNKQNKPNKHNKQHT